MQSKLFRVGDKVILTELLLIYYDLNTNLAHMKRGSGENVILPLSMSEFDLGMYGVHSKIHPTNLPTSHPDFCTWVDENKRLIRHTRTGEICLLELDDSFYATGVYKLRPKNSIESKTRTAPSWSPMQIKQHLDSLKGKEFTFKVRITSILYKDNLVNQILLNRITTERVSFTVSSIEWDSFAVIAGSLIKTYKNEKTKKRAR